MHSAWWNMQDIAGIPKSLNTENKVKCQHLVRKLYRSDEELHLNFLLAQGLDLHNSGLTGLFQSLTGSPSAKKAKHTH